jgi:hypothetical protein
MARHSMRMPAFILRKRRDRRDRAFRFLTAVLPLRPVTPPGVIAPLSSSSRLRTGSSAAEKLEQLCRLRLVPPVALSTRTTCVIVAETVVVRAFAGLTAKRERGSRRKLERERRRTRQDERACVHSQLPHVPRPVMRFQQSHHVIGDERTRLAQRMRGAPEFSARMRMSPGLSRSGGMTISTTAAESRDPHVRPA